jgi:hypothetical protein
MALTPQQQAEMFTRSLQRIVLEATNLNTINVADLINIDFVWYPGATDVTQSFVDTLMPVAAAGAAPREIPYKWSRTGMADITHNMTSARINVPLAPGSSGTLTVFDTQWKITRPAAGAVMSVSTGVQGIQQRLNALGYHLRAAGATAPGIDSANGPKTERAVLSFQVDYRKPAGAPAVAPAGPLRVRGEMIANPGMQGNLDFYNGNAAPGTTANPSAADSALTQAALVAAAGA